MRLRPHLHILVPSSTDGVALEARIYLSPFVTPTPALPLTDSSDSKPGPGTHIVVPETMRIHTLITAAHPWQKLGGNMLDPILASSLVHAAEGGGKPTAVVTFNARGVGLSGGSQGLFGLNTVPGENDFGAVEEWARRVLEPQRVKRVGYSWGSVAAVNAPADHEVEAILLVSPASTLFTLTTGVFSSRPFSNALKARDHVTVVHGTRDQFTSTKGFESLEQYGVKRVVVEGADHFYRSNEHSAALDKIIQDWINE